MKSNPVALTENEKTTIVMLRQFADRGATEPEQTRIVEIAETTDSHSVRHAAALAMADLHVPGADQVLIRLLSRPDTKRHRGTLLYALDEWGGSLPLPLVVRLLLDENYEVREETLVIVGKRRVTGTIQDLEAALSALQRLANDDDEYIAAVGDRAVSWLRPLRRRFRRQKADSTA